MKKKNDHFRGHQKLYFLTPTVKDHENQGKVHPFFVEYNLIPLVFIAKYFFYHSSTTPVVGVTLGELEKLIFLIKYKKKLIISGDLFFLKCSPV